MYLLDVCHFSSGDINLRESVHDNFARIPSIKSDVDATSMRRFSNLWKILGSEGSFLIFIR